VKTLKISDETHKKLKDYCSIHLLKMNEWVDKILKEYIKKNEQKTNK